MERTLYEYVWAPYYGATTLRTSTRQTPRAHLGAPSFKGHAQAPHLYCPHQVADLAMDLTSARAPCPLRGALRIYKRTF